VGEWHGSAAAAESLLQVVLIQPPPPSSGRVPGGGAWEVGCVPVCVRQRWLGCGGDRRAAMVGG
jgi:hypothetical protein